MPDVVLMERQNVAPLSFMQMLKKGWIFGPGVKRGLFYTASKIQRYQEAELKEMKMLVSVMNDNASDAEKMEELLKDLCVTFEKTVKSLGVGLGAGVRRNTKVMAARIQSLAARIHWCRMPKQLGFDTSMLLRTGGKQAMTYALGINRVSDDMLRDMRRVAAAIASPASWTGGQNLDAALIVADGGPSGCADPAFDGHLLPIGEWAAAVWNERLPLESMHRMVTKGKRQIATARNV